MAGRPKALIDWLTVGKMLEADCTAVGIAEQLGISVDTLYKRCKSDNKVDFSAFAQQKKAKGDDLLKVKQYSLAMNGNVTMLIWLGKQRLGQSDKQQVTGDSGGPLTLKVIYENKRTGEVKDA